MTLVVDASVAVKWFAREALNDQARALITRPDDLIAPDWLLAEAASTFWKKVKGSELLEIHAERHLKDLPLFFARLYPAVDLVAPALRLAFNMRHSVYDCLYVALASRERATLVTADADLVKAARRAKIDVEVELLA